MIVGYCLLYTSITIYMAALTRLAETQLTIVGYSLLYISTTIYMAALIRLAETRWSIIVWYIFVLPAARQDRLL